MAGAQLTGLLPQADAPDELQRLRESEARLRMLLASVNEVVFIIDAQERYVEVFGRWLEQNGRLKGQLLGHTAREAFGAAACAAHEEANRRALAGEYVTYEWSAEGAHGTHHFQTTLSPLVGADGRVTGIVGSGRDITARKRADESFSRMLTRVNQARREWEATVDALPVVVALLDGSGRVRRANRTLETWGIARPEPAAAPVFHRLLHPHCGRISCPLGTALDEALARGIDVETEIEDQVLGRTLMLHLRGVPAQAGGPREERSLVAVLEDIGARRAAERERAALEVQLRHAQKLEAIGQLAAGIAHEINTPTQFVGDNLVFLRDSVDEMRAVAHARDRLLDLCRQGAVDAAEVHAIERSVAGSDIAYLLEEIPKAITQSLEGVSRVATIVRAMKEFSHPGTAEKTPQDLHRAIDNTLTVARNRWKYVADVVTEFDPALPPVPVHPGEFNQVILNLVVNAADAIVEARQGIDEKGTIRITTRHDSGWAEVRVADDGTGIPPEVRDRIFEPFFTTKEVGRGSGQGLAMVHAIVTAKHGGTITFQTAAGVGTTFIIRLPIDAAPA